MEASCYKNDLGSKAEINNSQNSSVGYICEDINSIFIKTEVKSEMHEEDAYQSEDIDPISNLNTYSNESMKIKDLSNSSVKCEKYEEDSYHADYIAPICNLNTYSNESGKIKDSSNSSEKKTGSHFGSKMGRKKDYKSLQMKKKILGEMKAGVPMASLMVEYGVGRTTLYDWRRDMAKIEKYAAVVSQPGCTRYYKSGYFSEIEDDLSLWIQERQKCRFILSYAIIQAKAKQLYDNLPESSHTGKQPFVASSGWVARFFKRHGHNIGAVKSDGAEAEKFWQKSPEVKDPFLHHIFTTDDESGTPLEANEDEHK